MGPTIIFKSIECRSSEASTRNNSDSFVLAFGSNILRTFDLTCGDYQDVETFEDLEPQKLDGAAAADVQLWRFNPDNPLDFQSCMLTSISNNDLPKETTECFTCFGDREICLTYCIETSIVAMTIGFSQSLFTLLREAVLLTVSFVFNIIKLITSMPKKDTSRNFSQETKAE